MGGDGTNFQVLNAVLKYHGENPAVRFIQDKSASVYTEPPKALLPDGEIFGATPTEITLLPQLVKYFI